MNFLRIIFVTEKSKKRRSALRRSFWIKVVVLISLTDKLKAVYELCHDRIS